MTAERELRAMLPRLDAAIEREIIRLRGRYQLSLDELRGLYVSDDQVDSLLHPLAFHPRRGLGPAAVPPPARWTKLISDFGLDQVEADILLLAAAAEIDTRYPVLFAYLNDDVSARRPTVDLAIRLIGEGWDGRDAIRTCLSPTAPLVKSGLVCLGSNAANGPQTPISLAPLAARHLLGGDAVAAADMTMLPPGGTLDPDCASARLAASLVDSSRAPIVILAGRDGTGRRKHAADIAGATGRRVAMLTARPDEAGDRLKDAILAARLVDASLLIEADALEGSHAEQIACARIPVMLMVADPTAWESSLAPWPNLTLRFKIPPLEQRRSIWREALRSEGVRAPAPAVRAAAARFRLSEGAVRRAARDARVARLAAGGGSGAATADQLMEAARRQCTLDLGQLARRIDARPDWDDLVLPPGVLEQLRDFAGASGERDRVFETWGMGRVGRAAGRGVSALFAGASGTGKTMSAAVIARATGLDLWRIDLSSVVSKYIGETEKNLERIFTGARDGDAILFFDEADALFAKRSDVRDAHDRYANVEVSYLLQRLEEHDGISILASNFSRNIDQAFVRRLNYIVEFPLPDARLRERLWRKAFAPETPVANDIDHAFLGQQFNLSGGDIRSAALDAAFLAANDGGTVAMAHILRAVSRQMLKQGRLPRQSESASWREPPSLTATATAAE